jgi:hypothetical protein
MTNATDKTVTKASVIRQLNLCDFMDDEIEATLDCYRSEVVSALWANNDVPTASLADTARMLHDLGWSIAEIASNLKQHYSTVYRAVNGW